MNISFPQLADVVRDLPDGGGAGPRAGGRDAAGVSRVPDVGDVGGDVAPQIEVVITQHTPKPAAQVPLEVPDLELHSEEV